MIKLQVNTNKGEVMNISKIKAVCKVCETEIIFNIGKKVRFCPVCNAEFTKFDDDRFYELATILKELDKTQTLIFIF